MDFMALHLKVLPWIRLRKDKENISNIFYWDNLAQARLHVFPYRTPAQTHLFVLPSPWDVTPAALCQLGTGKREQCRENSLLAAQEGQGMMLGGFQTQICGSITVHKVSEGHKGC